MLGVMVLLYLLLVVRGPRVELGRVAPRGSKPRASASSAIRADRLWLRRSARPSIANPPIYHVI